MKIEPVLHFIGTERWITALLFLCLLLLAWVKTAYPKKFFIVIKDVFVAALPEEEWGVSPASVALFFVFLCSTALLIMQLLHTYGIKLFGTNGREFAMLTLILFGIYMGKTLLTLFIGFIFEQQQRAVEYISEIYVFAHLLGLVLLPLVMVDTYSLAINQKLFGESVLFGIGLLYIYRTIKMFIVMMNKGLSMMYLFLYICALEILPLALFYRYGVMSL